MALAEREFKIGPHTYRVSKHNVFGQFDLARKLGPVIGLMTLQEDKAEQRKHFPQGFSILMGQFPKGDVDFVLDSCLSNVVRKQGEGGWVPVRVGGELAFVDINMQDMLIMVWEALEVNNLFGFFTEPKVEKKV